MSYVQYRGVVFFSIIAATTAALAMSAGATPRIAPAGKVAAFVLVNGPMGGSGGGSAPRGGGGGGGFGGFGGFNIQIPLILPSPPADNFPDYVTLPPDPPPPPQIYWVPPPPAPLVQEQPPAPAPAGFDPSAAADANGFTNLLFPQASGSDPPSKPDPDAGIFELVKQTAYQAADENAARDNWTVRGVPGVVWGCAKLAATAMGAPDLVKENAANSCDGAAMDRGSAIAAALQPLADSGQLRGYTVAVGIRQGYFVGGSSWHTYTVLTIYDANHVPVKSYNVDNYVGSSIIGTQVGHTSNDPPNFDGASGNSQALFGVKPRPPAPPTLTPWR